MSDVVGLNAMMRTYLREAGAWVTKKVGDVEDGDETEDEPMAGEVRARNVMGNVRGSRVASRSGSVLA